ncbi:MAG: hypothetical protein AAF441_13350 [Pseudomonadota bacterium]
MLHFEHQRGIRPKRDVSDPQAAEPAASTGPRQLIPYVAAHRKKQDMQAAAPAGQKPKWVDLGPTSIPQGQTYGKGGNNRPPVSGRIAGVAVDPSNTDRILIASAGGGVWVSENRGKTWSPRTDDHAVLSMGAIAAAPSKPGRFYAGTGEGDNESQLGVGLLRSLDGGLTWRRLSSGFLSGVGVYDIAVDPTDHRHLLIGTWWSLIESLDGGATYFERESDLYVWDFSFNPDDPQEVFAATSRGLLVSSNGGADWQVQVLDQATYKSVERMEVCRSPSDPAVVYVVAAVCTPNDIKEAVVWRRDMPGGPFRRQAPVAETDLKQADYDWCAAVDPADPNVLYVGAVELLRGLRVSDADWAWENISSRQSGDSIHPDQHHIAFDPSDPDVVYIANDGGLYRSDNGGITWESLNEGLGITEFEYIAQHPSNLSWILGGTQDNGTLRHVGGGVWDQVASGDGGDCGVSKAEPNVCFHSFFGMGVEVSFEAGDSGSWYYMGPECIPMPRLFYPPLEIRNNLVAQGGSILVIAEVDPQEETFFDWEASYLPQPDPKEPELCSAICFCSDAEILIGTNQGRIYRVSGGVGEWSSAELVSTPQAGGVISDIAPDPANPDRIWVTCSTISGGHVFLSDNGAVTWTNKSAGLPNIPVNAVVVDPLDSLTVYVGADNGVYRTSDGGNNWDVFSHGLPNAVVGDLLLH